MRAVFTGSSPFGTQRSALRLDLVACGLLALLTLVFTWQIAVLGYLPNSTDFILQYYPNLAFLGNSLKAGEIPLWNPLLFAGTPYLADPQSQLLYLPDWPFLVLLDTATAARAILVSHFALATVGMYGYLRTIQLPRRAAFLGAVIYGLGPYATQLVAWPPMLMSLAWMPGVLMLVERAIQRRSLGAAVLAALALVFQFFSGWPHGGYMTVFAVVAIFVLHGAVEIGALRTWRGLVSIGGIGLLIGGLAVSFASPLWLPFLEYWGQSNYITERGLESVGTDGSVTLLTLVGVGGSEGHGAYLGITAVVLALLGVACGRNKKYSLVLFVVGLFGLLVALGASTPLYGYLYAWMPGFRTFHMPGRFMLLFVFSASTLAAIGSDALLRIAARQSAVVAIGASLAALAILCCGLIWTMGTDTPRQLASNLIHPDVGLYLNPAMASHVAAAMLVAAMFLVALASNLMPRTAAFYLALLIVVADVLLFQGKDAQYVSRPPAILRADSPAPIISKLTGADGEFRIAGFQQMGVNHFMSDFPSNLNPALVPPNLSLMTGFEDLQGYLPLQIHRYADYMAAINGGVQDYHWALVNNFQSPLLDLLNLGYVAIRDNEDRLTNVTIASNLEPGPPSNSVTVHPVPVLATGLQVHSYLGNSVDLEDGHEVARVEVTDTSGQIMSFALRAGIETAEWAYDRPDVVVRVRHHRPPISTTRNLPASTHTYAASLVFPSPITISRVTVERIEPNVTVTVQELIAVPVRPTDRYERIGELDGATLYRNKLALPRVLVVPRAEMAATPEEAMARIQAPDFDPRQAVVVEGQLQPTALTRPRESGTDAHALQIGIQDPTGFVGGAEVKARGSNFVRVAVRAASPGFLLLNEISYPGWNGYLDGTRVTVWRANYLFRAIEVPPGEHNVEFCFEPDSLKLGLALSLSTLTLLLTAAAALRLKSRQQRKESTLR